MVSSSTTSGPVSGAAPKATATQSPLPVSVIFVALIVITIILGDSAGKKKMIYRKNYFFFIIICWILLLSVFFLSISAHAEVASSLMITGSVPLTAYNITSTDIGADKAIITWKTNGLANSTVEYGTTTGYGSTSIDDVMNTSHIIQLNGLSSFTVYHYRIISKMSDGQSVTGADANFKTTYPTGTTIATKTAGTTVTGVTTKTVDGAQQV